MGKRGVVGGGPPSGQRPPEPEVQQVALASIDLEDRTFQYREPGDVEDLVRSIHEQGLLQAVGLLVSATGALLRIIYGFRRVKAAVVLRLETIAARVYRISEEEAHVLAYIENAVRKNPSRLEKANGIHLAHKNGLSVEQIARACGLSERQVLRYLDLLDFPSALKTAWEAGRIRLSHAKILADAHVQDVEGWIKKIKTGKWSDQQLCRELRKDSRAASSGRGRTYALLSRDNLRMYRFEVSSTTPAEQLESVATMLSASLELVTAWRKQRGTAGADAGLTLDGGAERPPRNPRNPG